MLNKLLTSTAIGLLLLAGSPVVGVPSSAQAQVSVATACSTQTLPVGYLAGSLVVLRNGDLCTNGSGSGGGASYTAAASGTVPVTAGTNKPAGIDLFSSQSVLVKDASGNPFDFSAPASVSAAVTTAAPTYTTGTDQKLSLDTSGGLRVNVIAGGTSGTVAQGSTTSGQSGNLVQGAVTTAAPTYTTAQTSPLSLDTTGALRVNVTAGGSGGGIVTQATASNLNAQVVGNVANAATDSGNPVKVGGVFSASGVRSSYTAGQRADLQTDGFGNAYAALVGKKGSGGDAVGNTNSMGFIGDPSNTGGALYLPVAPQIFGGTNWDRVRSVTDTTGSQAGTGVASVANIPTSAAGQAIAPITSTAAEGSHVLKASAGNGYRYAITTGGTAGFLMIFDATSAPADGAVTPKLCRTVAANSSLEVDHSMVPDRFTTGITAVFSSTGCFTKTVSATAEIEGHVQ